MIIATVTALIILFSGGYEIFFIENVEKGIKEYVVDKARQKELLSKTKEAKTFVKGYNKQREVKFKDFKTLYTSYSTSEDELTLFFDDVHELQGEFQQGFMEKRIDVTAGINEDEWEKMVDYSKAARQKKADKAAKKNKDKKDAFLKTKKKIDELEDASKKEVLLSELKNFTSGLDGLLTSIQVVNIHENEILAKKSSTETELISLYDEINKIRSEIFDSLVSYHKVIKDQLDSETGEQLLQVFYKDLELAPM